MSESPSAKKVNVVGEPQDETMDFLRLEWPACCFSSSLEKGQSFHLNESVLRSLQSSRKDYQTIKLVCPCSCCRELIELDGSGACPP